MVVVHTLHVIAEVPLAREAVALNGTLAALIDAEEGLVTVSMQSVSLTFVTQQAGGGGEASPFARICLATVWLQV